MVSDWSADSGETDTQTESKTHTQTATLTRDGLRIPEELRECDGQVIIRTPNYTIKHAVLPNLAAVYEGIDESHFGAADSFEGADAPINPELCPDKVAIQHTNDDPVVLEVVTDWSGGDVPGSYLPAEVADE